MKSGLRQVIFFVSLLGMTFLAYQYMIKPANGQLAQKRVQVQKKLEKLVEFEEASLAVKDFEKQLEELQQAIEILESKLPPQSDIAKVLEQVTIIAQKQGLKPKTIRTLKKKDSNGYMEQPLKMALEGDFNSFYSFLLELEQLPRITRIRELKMNKIKDKAAKANEDGGIISADFVVSIFFQNKAS